MIDKYTTETDGDEFNQQQCRKHPIISVGYTGGLFLYIFQRVSSLLTGTIAYQRYG